MEDAKRPHIFELGGSKGDFKDAEVGDQEARTGAAARSIAQPRAWEILEPLPGVNKQFGLLQISSGFTHSNAHPMFAHVNHRVLRLYDFLL